MDKKNLKYDFGGYATKNNIRCADGRTIHKDAFAHNDGAQVPLVFMHDHKNLQNIVGHAILENREDGVYAYCSLNDTALGKTAKEQIQHGDIRALSIYANHLKQSGNDVIHGEIREVSIVIAGANPGAVIDTVISHSEEGEEEAYIYHEYDEEGLVMHSDDSDKNDNDTTSQNSDNEHDSDPEVPPVEHGADGKTVKDVLDTYNEEQRNVLAFLLAKTAEEAKKEIKHSEENDNTHKEIDMKPNVFDKGTQTNTINAELLHSAFVEIKDKAETLGSFKKAYNEYVSTIAHDDTKAELMHSITDVGNLFPEFQSVNKEPNLLKRETAWVATVMNGVHRTPFSKVKSTYVDITADEARAKGYVKGNEKADEVIVALKRTTSPTTVYKYQKLDRDDTLDITDFDVLLFIKMEMRIMLEEEIARAILIGDGRSSISNDKINESNIRPILSDDSAYTIGEKMVRGENESEAAFGKRFINTYIKKHKLYKGSGNMVCFMNQDLFADLLLIEDTNGRVIYDTVDKLATRLMVSKVVPVPVMDEQTREVSSKTYKAMAIFVDLNDYNVGADKGGSVKLFDDFDLNYNKLEYLIETRCSGALIKPKSALVFEEEVTEEVANG